jgi:hypothetical protein
LKRRALVAQAKAKGQTGTYYVCNQKPYTHHSG